MISQCQKQRNFLEEKALWVKRETLKIHKIAPETRIASSLSAVEILVALYYGKVLRFDPKNTNWARRDRMIVSKGHGAISLYPILADLSFFDKRELENVCKEGTFLGGIPDSIIPGFETINGSLGHGLGVACGKAFSLRQKKTDESVFVLMGDGELFEGSVWEAIMFAGEHKLDNLVLIIDKNQICMLDYCKNVLDLDPLEEKFRAFRWDVQSVDGHDVNQVCSTLAALKQARNNRPKVMIANTIKGKGTFLENDPLCHIKNIKPADIEKLLGELA